VLTILLYTANALIRKLARVIILCLHA